MIKEMEGTLVRYQMVKKNENAYQNLLDENTMILHSLCAPSMLEYISFSLHPISLSAK